jgi:lysophospholipase L1-like esterase
VRRLVALVSVTGLVLTGCTFGPGAPTAVPQRTVGGAVDSPSPVTVGASSLRFVTLGDSYTSGTGVRSKDRWPNQLVRALRPQIELDLIDNLAASGATSLDVVETQLPGLGELEADVVSLLVGVNDVVREFSPDEYQLNLSTILDAIVTAGVPVERILLVTSPDYTLTPHGAYRDATQESETIALFNGLMAAEAERRGAILVDISPVSDLVPRDPTLLAGDELHPSGKQYAGWVELIAPVMRERLDRRG